MYSEFQTRQNYGKPHGQTVKLPAAMTHMYNLSLPNLCATCSSLATLRLPTVDPYSAEVPGKMRSYTVLCGDLYMCLCRH